MSMKIVIDDVYLKVVATLGWLDDDTDVHIRCLRTRELAKEIKRHCDDVETTELCVDSHKECSFCGYPWESCFNDDGKIECCEEAMKEEEA